MMIRLARRAGLIAALLLTAVCFAGCGIRLPGPTGFDNLTLGELEAIQDDELLTENEKREKIRELVGAPEDEDGDRLVDFLLNFNVP